METKMVVENDQLKEYREPGYRYQNPVIRFTAKVISYIFHPLFVPVYIIAFLMQSEPYLFASLNPFQKIMRLLQFFVMYTFFPLVTILLLKGLGFIQSVYLKTQKERIIPYIVCGIYYFWICYVLRHQAQHADKIVQLSMAIFIASSIGLIANIYMKISMHAMCMGVLLFFTASLVPVLSSNFTLYMSVVLLIVGLVCTARLIVSDHTPAEIYMGLFVGAASQLLAVWADGILP